MVQADTIDFLRDDFGGSWLLPVLFGLAFGFGVFTNHTVKNYKQDGWRGSFKKFLLWFVVGVICSLPVVVFLLVWERWPPQHFISLKVEERQVRLGQHWPDDDIVIPIGEIKSLSRIRERENSRRWRCSRIVIETGKETFRSFGYDNLSDDDVKIWERLVGSFEKHKLTRTTPPTHTNNPPLNPQQ